MGENEQILTHKYVQTNLFTRTSYIRPRPTSYNLTNKSKQSGAITLITLMKLERNTLFVKLLYFIDK